MRTRRRSPTGRRPGTGPFRCLSTQQGMTCTVTSGKGFQIASGGITHVSAGLREREVPFLSDEFGELEVDPIGILEQAPCGPDHAGFAP